MFVFIGHGDADRDFAAEIAGSLRKAGIDAWLDASDVEPGTNWLRSGARALDRAEKILKFLKTAASGSASTASEGRRNGMTRSARRLLDAIG